MGLDASKPLDTQVYDEQTGMTWEQYFLETALSNWHGYVALTQQAEEGNYQLSEDTLTAIASVREKLESAAQSYSFANAEEMIKADWSAVCNVDGYVNYVNTYLEGMDFYNYRYEQYQPTQEEQEAFFAEHMDEYSQIGVT